MDAYTSLSGPLHTPSPTNRKNFVAAETYYGDNAIIIHIILTCLSQVILDSADSMIIAG